MRIDLKRKFLLIPSLVICLAGGPLHATQYVDIEADNSKMVSGGQTIETQGKDFHYATKWSVGKNVFYPTITTAEAYPGHKSSFEITLNPHTGHNTPGEKMLLDLVVGEATPKHGHDAYSPTFGQTKTLGFAVKFAGDDQYKEVNGLMLFEWYQAGSKSGAILMLSTEKGTLQWQVHTGNSPTTSTNLPGATLELNKWYYIVTSVKLGAANDGEMTVWQNGVQVIHKAGLSIGFDPTKPYKPGASGHPDPNFNVCVGLYRSACPYKAHVYMDMMRWGDTYDDVKAPNP